MGIYERDYMRPRQQPRASRRRTPGAGGAGSLATPIAIVAVVVVALFAVSRQLIDRRHAQPFPPTGEAQWYAPPSASPTAPLTVSAPAHARLNYIVRLDDWQTRAPLVLIPVRAGETAETPIPLGRYRMTIAKGQRWLGSAQLFGAGGDVREAEHPLEFYRTGRQTMGHRIRLDAALDGNLPTRPARPY